MALIYIQRDVVICDSNKFREPGFDLFVLSVVNQHCKSDQICCSCTAVSFSRAFPESTGALVALISEASIDEADLTLIRSLNAQAPNICLM